MKTCFLCIKDWPQRNISLCFQELFGGILPYADCQTMPQLTARRAVGFDGRLSWLKSRVKYQLKGISWENPVKQDQTSRQIVIPALLFASNRYHAENIAERKWSGGNHPKSCGLVVRESPSRKPSIFPLGSWGFPVEMFSETNPLILRMMIGFAEH